MTRRASAVFFLVLVVASHALPPPPPKPTLWPPHPSWSVAKSNLTADLLVTGKVDSARVAALDARDAAVSTADAALAAKGLPTVTAAIAKHTNASAAARAAAKGAAAGAAAKLRRDAVAARRTAVAAAVKGTTPKSDAIMPTSQKLNTAADVVDVADLMVGHALDVKAAKKGPPRRTMTVAVALQLPGPFADGTGVTVVSNDGPAVPGRRRRGLAQETTVPSPLMTADTAALAAAQAGSAAANFTPPPDVIIDVPLVDTVRVRDDVLGLLHARLRALGSAAGLTPASLSANATPVDATGDVYAVSVTFRGVSTAAALANAVNDVPARGRACAGWIERVGFDFCGALAAATPLVVNGVEARADFNASPDTLVSALSLGRRSNFPRGPVSIGEPRIVVRTSAGLSATAFGMSPYDTHSKIKDLFWYIEKGNEGIAGFIEKRAAVTRSKELERIERVYVRGGQRAKDAKKNAENAFKSSTLSAQKWGSALGAIRGVMAVLGTAVWIWGFVSIFTSDPQPDPKIMAALDTIFIATNQTLNLVKDIKAELDVIQTTLKRIEDKIDKLKCGTSIKLLVDSRNDIEARWDAYNNTLLPLVQDRARLRQPLPASLSESVDEWATGVIGSTEQSMRNIGDVLAGIDALPVDFLLIAECGRAFANDAAALNPFPADDRVVYNQSLTLTATLLMIVNRAATMLTEAHSWRAQTAYKTALTAYIASSCSGNITLCPSFGTSDMPFDLGLVCAQATANTSSSLPYSAALVSCSEKNRVDGIARDMTLRAMELLGAPYSWGDRPGEGLRLVLGTDVVRPGDGKVPFTAPSVWLVPASPGAFDPACTLPNATAESGCSLVGDFNDTSNSAWAHLKYPLGIDATYWQASAEPWPIMRYVANLTAVEGATGDAASLIARMEGTGMVTAYGQVPFSNISDRLWWVPNTTFDATLLDFGLRDPPGHTIVPADSESYERYYIDPSTMSINTRCFVAAGANVTTAVLPTGMVCDARDMVGVFDGPCTYNRWSGSSTFSFQGTHKESHDYSVACPVSPRPWFVASPIGSRPDLAGRAAWPPLTPLTVVCPALNKYLDDQRDAGTTPDGGQPVSQSPTCGLSVAATTGRFRDSNTCTEEGDASTLYCHHATLYYLDVYGRRTCSLEPRYVGIAVSPTADACVANHEGAGAGAHRLAYPIFDLASPYTTLPLSPALRAQAPPPPKLFRLPAVNVSNLPSIASPFSGQPYCDPSRQSVFGTPRQCGPGATSFIVDTVGAGDAFDNTTFPLFDAVNNTATRVILSLAPGTDNVTCASVWVRANGARASADEVVTLGVVFEVSAGPVLAADVGQNFPATVVDTFAGGGGGSQPTSTLSLSSVLPPGRSGAVPRFCGAS